MRGKMPQLVSVARFLSAAAMATLLVGLTPTGAHAQAYMYLDPTPEPIVNAAQAAWQRSGEAIFYRGDFYYPTGPDEFFDGRVMVRTGNFEGVPLYENSTLAPYDVVYVPVGRKMMRPYERRRHDRFAHAVVPGRGAPVHGWRCVHAG